MDEQQMEVTALIELALASTVDEISMMDEDDRVRASLEGSGPFEGATVRTFADAGVLRVGKVDRDLPGDLVGAPGNGIERPAQHFVEDKADFRVFRFQVEDDQFGGSGFSGGFRGRVGAERFLSLIRTWRFRLAGRIRHC